MSTVLPLHVSQDIVLEPGLSSFEIDSERPLELTFTARQDARVFVRIKHAEKLRIRTWAAPQSRVTFLFWNQDDEALEVEESHEVPADAEVRVAYGEMNHAPVRRNAFMALRESGAQGLLSSASLVQDPHTYNLRVTNFAPRTYGDIKNYAVVLREGKLLIDAVGKIVKGASRSESHQTSRALSFEAGQSTEILPELLIDENDVQASHAMSIGQVDEEQLYYMQSRGLDAKACVALLATGYLMPIADTLEDDELKKVLQEEMERKIGELCSM